MSGSWIHVSHLYGKVAKLGAANLGVAKLEAAKLGAAKWMQVSLREHAGPTADSKVVFKNF